MRLLSPQWGLAAPDAGVTPYVELTMESFFRIRIVIDVRLLWNCR